MTAWNFPFESDDSVQEIKAILLCNEYTSFNIAHIVIMCDCKFRSGVDSLECHFPFYVRYEKSNILDLFSGLFC